MNYAVLSLLFLFIAIACGYFLKMNTGLVAIALALVIGRIFGMDEKEIIAGFNGSLFVMLLGVSYLFSIASQNRTLELISRKIVSLTGKRTNLIPIIIFFLAAVLAGIGPGTVPVMALMAVFSMALAAEMKMNPVMLAAMGLLGAQAGGLTPIAPTGILGNTLAAEQGFMDTAVPLMFGQFIAAFLYAMCVYLFFKGFKIKTESVLRLADIEKFNKKQLITMAGIGGMVVLVLGFKVNAGLASFLMAGIIMMFRVADEKSCIAGVPWGTLILITGVNVLMNVVIKAGGIELMSTALASIMTPVTAVPIIGLTAGIMSWFSSTSGVVMPTLIPTVGSLVQSIQGINANEMITAIVTTSHTAGCSPISTGGALALAAYVTNTNATPEEQQGLFVKMFGVAIAGVIFMVVFAFLGGFRIVQ